MDFIKASHCVYHCKYHLVLPTKYRRNIFNESVFAYLQDKLKEIGKYYPEIRFETIKHGKDHIHLLVSVPPKFSVGSVVRIIKANTSRGLKAKFPFLKEVYWGTDGIWLEGYFVSTTGVNEEIIRKYIENQLTEDTGQAKLEF